MESKYDAKLRLLRSAREKLQRAIECHVDNKGKYAKEQTKMAIADLREVMHRFPAFPKDTDEDDDNQPTPETRHEDYPSPMA